MSTTAVTPNEPQVQATPTPAGQPTPAPVQPRAENGQFAPATPPVAAAPEVPAAPVTPQAPPSAPAPFTLQNLEGGRIRVTYETGENFEGTPAEVVARTAESHVNTKRWAQQQRTQQPTAPVAPVAPPSPFADPAEEQAAGYVADLIAKKAGYANASEMFQTINQTTNTSADYQNNQLAIQFMAGNPDFNPTPENSEKLLNTIVQNGFGDIYERGTQEQRYRLMEMAHSHNIKTGVYQPMPKQQGAPNVPITPPPPIPQGRSPQDTYAGVPPELVPTINDSQAVILDKISRLKAMGITLQ